LKRWQQMERATSPSASPRQAAGSRPINAHDRQTSHRSHPRSNC
jgi:hypothetical protein